MQVTNCHSRASAYALCRENQSGLEVYLNVAGREFPLKTNLDMARIPKLLNGTNDIESFTMPGHLVKRITHRYKVKNGKLLITNVHKDARRSKPRYGKGRSIALYPERL